MKGIEREKTNNRKMPAKVFYIYFQENEGILFVNTAAECFVAFTPLVKVAAVEIFFILR